MEIRLSSINEILEAEGFQQVADEYIALYNTDMPFPVPDWSMYRALERIGVLSVVGVFDGALLVGLLFLTVTTIPHYGCLLATTESIFIREQYRVGLVGIKLLKFAEQIALGKGAKGIITSAMIGSDYDHVMDRLGYRPTHTLYAKGFGQ